MPDSGGSPPARLPWRLRWRRSRQQSEDSDGFRSRSGSKSNWDWRFLLGLFIPILIGTIGWGSWQDYLNNLSHQHDQQIALEQQRASILQMYINNMRDLLLNQIGSKPLFKVRQVARVETLTTLRSLDAGRNDIVFQFLQEAHLIGIPNAVVYLSDANLSNDDLSGADLRNTDLTGTILSGANLDGADLRGATLSNAVLTGAILSGADLDGADLNSASLSDANLSDADLSNASLTNAFLGNANLTSSFLTGTRLNGAILTNAELNSAYLSGANFDGANLNGAILSGADLSDTSLLATSLSQPQLDSVYSCTNATLFKPLTCQHNVRITLTYWYTESQAEKPVIIKLVHQFEQLNPYINIKAVSMPFFQTQAEFMTAASKGSAPDVLRSDVGWVTQFASQGYLLNIDPYISQADLSDYLSGPLGYDHYSGGLYGLPQVTDFLTLMYNKAELQKAGITSPPATMADFETDAIKVVQSRSAKYGFETNGTSYYALPFLYAFGGGMLDQHNNPLVNDAGSVRGLNFLLKLQNIDKVMPQNVGFSNGTANPMVNDFMTGKTAMIFDGPYDVSRILAGASFKGNSGNLGIAGIPACPPDTPTCRVGQTGSPLGGQSYVISAGTTHPAEAYNFIRFMSSTPSQAAIAKANHTLPTRLSAYQDGVSSNRFISEFLPLMRTAVPRPAIPQTGQLFYAFDPNIAAALDGIESPIAALSAVAEAWNQLLASLWKCRTWGRQCQASANLQPTPPTHLIQAVRSRECMLQSEQC